MTVLIEVLGPGCAKCEMLARHAEQAATELGLDFTLNKVTEPAAIADRGVMLTPALVVNGTVLTAGHVIATEKIKRLLQGV